MAEIFKSKFFIISLIVICVLTLSAVVLNLIGYGSVVSDITNIVLTPFNQFADILKESFAGIAAYFTEFNRMKDEIDELKRKLEIAEALNEDTKILQEHNDMLSSFFGLKSEHMTWEFQDARVTSRASGNYLSHLIINKGSMHNIEKDMPVIAAKPSSSGGGYDYVIVGYISEVSLRSAKVAPFLHTGASIGAYIKRTSETGVIEGEFELERDNLCRIARLSKEAVIEPGDKIYSSGGGGIYPENLYIGEVTEVFPDDLSRTMTGIIKPAVDFGKIKDVMVIQKFESKFD